MKITECMTADVQTVEPQQSIGEAARMMLSEDAGTMPVCQGDKVIGMITDRDIAVRGIAQGLGPEALVEQVMSNGVVCCYDDQNVQDVAAQMSDRQVRRMPVLDRDSDRLVGIVSLADITRSTQEQAAAKALDGISRPGGEHSQQG